MWTLLLVRRNGFVLDARPMDHHRLGQVPGPGQDQRGVATPVREPKMPILEDHRGALIFDPEVPFPLMGRFYVGIVLAALPPAFERGKERLDAGVGGMGVQRVRRVPAHQVFRTQPDALVPHRAPEGHERLAVEPPTLAGERIQLFACADLHSAYLICTHILIFFSSPPKTGTCFTGDARAKADRRLTAWDESTAACGGLKPFPVSITLKIQLIS